ncbi:unnamed protein product [Protopolystoma xenopodis]|uniref:Uncharacterized protein n=1 Tax=Protopolystoma xenopodis TaxID=117903 RepID=A0A448WAM7_9PLAT|nr:unnamed protein product [Protopolystoma xenopodis]
MSVLRRLTPLLDDMNTEHHQVIAKLRTAKPQLDFPILYTEMFRLTEAEECELAQARTEQIQSHAQVQTQAYSQMNVHLPAYGLSLPNSAETNNDHN